MPTRRTLAEAALARFHVHRGCCGVPVDLRVDPGRPVIAARPVACQATMLLPDAMRPPDRPGPDHAAPFHVVVPFVMHLDDHERTAANLAAAIAGRMVHEMAENICRDAVVVLAPHGAHTRPAYRRVNQAIQSAIATIFGDSNE